MLTPDEPLTGNDLGDRVWIAAGARDGERRRNMAEAARLLAAAGIEIVRVSSLYETEPVDLPGDRTLLNAAIEARTGLTPRTVLGVCLAVERTLGRRREAGRGGLRPIDLDILLYEERIIHEPGLAIPHPRMHERLFVLEPLAEIAPEAWHPVLRRTAGSLLRECQDAAWVRKVGAPAAWLARA